MLQSSRRTIMSLAALLVVVSVPVAALVQMPAKYTLEDRIEFRLQTDATLKKYHLDASVNDDGVATLSGEVATEAQKSQAERVARIQGVTRVNNEIEIDPDADKTLAERAARGLNRAGEAITDAWISTKVHWFFVGEDLLAGSDIDVDTADGVVTLSGTVRSTAGRQRAVALTTDVDGVKRVIDQLTVKESSATAATRRPT